MCHLPRSSKIYSSKKNNKPAGQKGELETGPPTHRLQYFMHTGGELGLYAAVSLAALLQSPLQCVCLKLFWTSKHARIASLMTFVRHAGKWQKERVGCVCFRSNRTILVCFESCGQKDVLLPQSTSSPVPYICLHDECSPNNPAPYTFAPCYIHWYFP